MNSLFELIIVYGIFGVIVFFTLIKLASHANKVGVGQTLKDILLLALYIFFLVGFIYVIEYWPLKKDSGGFKNTNTSPQNLRYEDHPEYYDVVEDDSSTTNDESNDQPVGLYGDNTYYVCNNSSGNCYDLDADMSEEGVDRLYFPKGGWVDMDYSSCEDGVCNATDENGTDWELYYE